MNKVLFATTNPAKIGNYKEALEKNGIELITIKDLDFKLDVDESGKNAIENAYIKAKAYYDVTGITSIGMDNCLYIDGISEEEQPGTHVRRVNGKELSDDEMIEYYINFVHKYGGKLKAKWVFGMVIYDENGAREYTWSKSHFYLIDKASEKRNPGYPLNSISVEPQFNKYLVELTKEDKEKYKKKDNIDNVIEFIINNV